MPTFDYNSGCIAPTVGSLSPYLNNQCQGNTILDANLDFSLEVRMPLEGAVGPEHPPYYALKLHPFLLVVGSGQGGGGGRQEAGGRRQAMYTDPRER